MLNVLMKILIAYKVTYIMAILTTFCTTMYCFKSY